MERVLGASTSMEWDLPSSPVSRSTVVLLHIVFLVQWNQRRRRNTITVNYRTLIEKKRFHRLWLALLSHPVPTSSVIENCSCLMRLPRNHHEDRIIIEMGNGEGPQQHDAVHSSTRHARTIWNSIRETLVRIDRWMTRASLGAAPLLLYNCHLVWSCRALEEEYNQPFQSHWNYARILVCWGVWAYFTELALYRLVIRRLDYVSPRRVSDVHPADDSLASMRTKLLYRPLSTPTSLMATMLLVFHLQYPFVSPQIVPFLANPRFLDQFPAFSYVLCILILTFLSYQSQSVTAIATGSWIGLLWWYTGFLVQPYWNIPLCFAFCTMTMISARVDRRYGKDLIPCIDRVALNHNGDILVQNEQGQWVPMHVEGEHVAENDERSESSVSTDVSDTIDAFPHADDEEIYGSSRLREDDDDDDDPESPDIHRRGNPWAELVPLRLPISSDWATHMRSRRRDHPSLN